MSVYDDSNVLFINVKIAIGERKNFDKNYKFRSFKLAAIEEEQIHLYLHEVISITISNLLSKIFSMYVSVNSFIYCYFLFLQIHCFHLSPSYKISGLNKF